MHIADSKFYVDSNQLCFNTKLSKEANELRKMNYANVLRSVCRFPRKCGTKPIQLPTRIRTESKSTGDVVPFQLQELSE